MRKSQQLQPATIDEKVKEFKSVIDPILREIPSEEDIILKRFLSRAGEIDGDNQGKQPTPLTAKDMTAYYEATAVKNGHYLKLSIHQNDRLYAQSVRNSLIEEFKPNTTFALMILDTAISAYFRTMRSTYIYNILVQNPDGTVEWSKQKTNLIKEVSSQINIANQQFISSINFLKEMNSGLPSIKVQTKNAFIAQNQQFNADAKP